MPRVRIVVKGHIPKVSPKKVTPVQMKKMSQRKAERTLPKNIRRWLNDRYEDNRDSVIEQLRSGQIKNPSQSIHHVPNYRHTVLRFNKVKKGGASKVRIGPLRQGTLRRHGYSTKISAAKRHTALRKAVKQYSPLVVFRKLNAVAVLQKNKNPSTSRIFKSDSAWVRTTFSKQFK